MFKIFSKKRVVSSAVFLAFFMNLFSGYGVFGNGLVSIENFERFGSRIESFRGNSIGKVVIINDLHQNEEVQRNIKNILSILKFQEKENFKKVFVEGLEAGKLNLEILKVLPNEKREKYLDEFTRLGILTGAERFLGEGKRKDIEIFGAEDISVYLENFGKYYKSFEFLERFKGLIFDLKRGFFRLKKYFMTSEIKEFLVKEEEFEEKGELSRYLEYLEGICKVNDIKFSDELFRLKNLDERKKGLKFFEIEVEAMDIVKKIEKMLNDDERNELKGKKDEKYYLALDRILEEKNISIRKYLALSEYLNFLKDSKNLDEIKIINEISFLEEEIIEKLTRGKKDLREFFVNERKVKKLIKYLRNELSYFEAKSTEIELEEIEEFSKRIFREGDLSEDLRGMSLAKENMDEFYFLAEKRNEVMARNLLRERFKKGEVRAIVLGGFHAGGVKEILRASGVSFDEILPRSFEKNDKSLYQKRVKLQGERFNLAKGFNKDLEKTREDEQKSFINAENDKLQVLSVFSSLGLTLEGDKIDIFVEFLINRDGFEGKIDKKNAKNFKKIEKDTENLRNLEKKYNKLDDDLKYMIAVLAYYSGNKSIDIENLENGKNKLIKEEKILKEAGEKIEEIGKYLGVDVNLENVRKILGKEEKKEELKKINEKIEKRENEVLGKNSKNINFIKNLKDNIKMFSSEVLGIVKKTFNKIKGKIAALSGAKLDENKISNYFAQSNKKENLHLYFGYNTVFDDLEEVKNYKNKNGEKNIEFYRFEVDSEAEDKNVDKFEVFHHKENGVLKIGIERRMWHFLKDLDRDIREFVLNAIILHEILEQEAEDNGYYNVHEASYLYLLRKYKGTHDIREKNKYLAYHHILNKFEKFYKDFIYERKKDYDNYKEIKKEKYSELKEDFNNLYKEFKEKNKTGDIFNSFNGTDLKLEENNFNKKMDFLDDAFNNKQISLNINNNNWIQINFNNFIKNTTGLKLTLGDIYDFLVYKNYINDLKKYIWSFDTDIYDTSIFWDYEINNIRENNLNDLNIKLLIEEKEEKVFFNSNKLEKKKVKKIYFYFSSDKTKITIKHKDGSKYIGEYRKNNGVYERNGKGSLKMKIDKGFYKFSMIETIEGTFKNDDIESIDKDYYDLDKDKIDEDVSEKDKKIIESYFKFHLNKNIKFSFYDILDEKKSPLLEFLTDKSTAIYLFRKYIDGKLKQNKQNKNNIYSYDDFTLDNINMDNNTSNMHLIYELPYNEDKINRENFLYHLGIKEDIYNKYKDMGVPIILSVGFIHKYREAPGHAVCLLIDTSKKFEDFIKSQEEDMFILDSSGAVEKDFKIFNDLSNKLKLKIINKSFYQKEGLCATWAGLSTYLLREEVMLLKSKGIDNKDIFYILKQVLSYDLSKENKNKIIKVNDKEINIEDYHKKFFYNLHYEVFKMIALKTKLRELEKISKDNREIDEIIKDIYERNALIDDFYNEEITEEGIHFLFFKDIGMNPFFEFKNKKTEIKYIEEIFEKNLEKDIKDIEEELNKNKKIGNIQDKDIYFGFFNFISFIFRILKERNLKEFRYKKIVRFDIHKIFYECKEKSKSTLELVKNLLKKIKDIIVLNNINIKDFTKILKKLRKEDVIIYENKNKNRGIIYYKNGDRYEGKIKDGVKEGEGIYYYRNGERYKRKFKNDKKDGYGKYFYNNGDRYEGDWKEDKIVEGKGKFVLNGIRSYEGIFINGKRNGKGKVVYTNDSRYEGDFKNGKKDGYGKYFYKNGNRYEGDWENGKKEGKGIFYFNDGDRYEGDFKNGKFEGIGIFYYANGDRYEGSFKDDKKAGKGIYYCYNKGKIFCTIGRYFYTEGNILYVAEQESFIILGDDKKYKIKKFFPISYITTDKNLNDLINNKFIEEGEEEEYHASSAFTGSFTNNLFDKKVKTKKEPELSENKNIFSKLKNSLKNSKEILKKVLSYPKDKILKFLGEMDIFKGEDENYFKEILNKLEEIAGEKIDLEEGFFEIADLEVNELQSNFEKYGENYKIKYRITEGFLKILGKIEKFFYRGEDFNEFLEEGILHEILENLYKIIFTEYYKKKYGDKNIEKDGKTWEEWEYYLSHDAHEFALSFAGEKQKIISKNFRNIEKLIKFEEKLEKEKSKLTKEEIEEAINAISALNFDFKNFYKKNIYKNFPSIKSEVQKYIKENILDTSREIVIDISGKKFVDIENKLEKFKNNFGWRCRKFR